MVYIRKEVKYAKINSQNIKKTSTWNKGFGKRGPVVSKSFISRIFFTKGEAEEIANRVRTDVLNGGVKGEISVNILYNKNDGNPATWKTIPFRNLKEIIEFGGEYYPEEDPDRKRPKAINYNSIHAITVNIMKTGNNVMGESSNNDCLYYDCLKKSVPELENYGIKNAKYLKEICGVKRDDKIPVEKLSLIENMLTDYKIILTGDYNYYSKKKAKETLYLYLDNEHVINCNWEPKRNSAHIPGVTLSSRNLIMYKFFGDPDKIKCYGQVENKKRSFQMSIKDKNKHNNADKSTELFVKCKNNSNLKEEYEGFIVNAEFIKKKLHEDYDLYKTGLISKSVLNRFLRLNRNINPESINPLEAQWIISCNTLSLTYYLKNYKGPGHEYDFASKYPSIYVHHDFMFPIKTGEFIFISKEEFNNMKFFKYGIYRAIVTGYNPKLFQLNKNNYYTHYDLNFAKKFGYEIDLIFDDQPNFLHYSPDKLIKGRKVFDTIVNELFKYKKKHTVIKKLLNSLWGVLCEKNKDKYFVSENKDCNIRYGMKIKSILRIKNYDLVKCLNKINVFKTNWARIGPFITGFCRREMANILKPIENKVIRVHTDGFLTTEPIKFEEKDSRKTGFIKIGNNLGELKYEGYCENLHIINLNNIIDLDTDNFYKKSF